MENLLTNIPAFLFALGVIVFVHEFGHYVVAKLFGVRVLTFSIGFGKRLWGFEHGGTDYRVAAIPLGGYVRMGGELPDESSGHPTDFLSKPRWQRILIYLAGPAMNAALAVALIAGAFMIGTPYQALQNVPSVVGVVLEGSAAEEAGWLVGDRIVRVDGEDVELWNDLNFLLASAPGRTLEVELIRGSERLTTQITPRKDDSYQAGDAGVFPQIALRFLGVMENSPASRAGIQPGDEILAIDGQAVEASDRFIEAIQGAVDRQVELTIRRDGEMVNLYVTPELDGDSLYVTPELDGDSGRIGVTLGYYRSLPLGEALVESVKYNIDIIKKTLQVLGKLFSNEIQPQTAVSGPIEIAKWTGKAARQSLTSLIFLMGFLSVSIGFMNLLPIPILDGGHICILLVESLMRRDLSLILKERITQFGFMVLMMLMIVVIFFDLARNLPSLISGS